MVKLRDVGMGDGMNEAEAMTTLRISDCRSGTAGGSTKRVPTQKSVHPVLGSRRNPDKRITHDEQHESNRFSVASSLRLFVTNPDSESDEEEDDESGVQSPHDRCPIDRKPVDGSTVTPDSPSTSSSSDGLWSTRTMVNGHETARRCTSAQSDSTSSFERSDPLMLKDEYSLVLDSDEYEYLLSLHSLTVRNGLCGPDVVRLSREGRSISFSRACEPSSKQDDASLPQPGGAAADSETAFGTVNHLIERYEVGGPPSHDYRHDDGPDRVSTLPGIRQSYREHLRRIYVSPYNGSPTPNTAWVVVQPPPESVAGVDHTLNLQHGSKQSGNRKRGLVRGGRGGVLKKLKGDHWRLLKK
ncbi:hypothetical protein I316_03363 [Kwoniella heveanensis BCC8398]|uniref:Uncharacterized protein n=1 Tax=Kwoniella heveanensis BCC8398 TaxID=1296120 RepID=A0A1B9GUV9_9TREE|nr:hypothetical protein I316_03363 [Kwoniella heveanensis BCC8398]